MKLSFSAGDYVISNLKCFIGSGEILQEDSLYQSEFQPDFVKTKGNRISGTDRGSGALEAIGDSCPKYVVSMDPVAVGGNGITRVRPIGFLSDDSSLRLV